MLILTVLLSFSSSNLQESSTLKETLHCRCVHFALLNCRLPRKVLSLDEFEYLQLTLFFLYRKYLTGAYLSNLNRWTLVLLLQAQHHK